MRKNKVKFIREYYGITQLELGDMVGLGASTISDIENGRHYPDVYKALNIAVALKTPLQDLFWEEKEK